jgi:hypothetical protein
MRKPKRSTDRELSDSAAREMARGLLDYIRKPGNRGLSFALDARVLAPLDRAAVIVAVHDLEDEP